MQAKTCQLENARRGQGEREQLKILQKKKKKKKKKKKNAPTGIQMIIERGRYLRVDWGSLRPQKGLELPQQILSLFPRSQQNRMLRHGA
jgi:hypothetical protein